MRVCCIREARVVAVGSGRGGLGRCIEASTAPSLRRPVRVRRVPVPARGDHGCGSLVPALRGVIPAGWYHTPQGNCQAHERAAHPHVQVLEPDRLSCPASRSPAVNRSSAPWRDRCGWDTHVNRSAPSCRPPVVRQRSGDALGYSHLDRGPCSGRCARALRPRSPAFVAYSQGRRAAELTARERQIIGTRRLGCCGLWATPAETRPARGGAMPRRTARRTGRRAGPMPKPTTPASPLRLRGRLKHARAERRHGASRDRRAQRSR